MKIKDYILSIKILSIILVILGGVTTWKTIQHKAVPTLIGVASGILLLLAGIYLFYAMTAISNIPEEIKENNNNITN